MFNVSNYLDKSKFYDNSNTLEFKVKVLQHALMIKYIS